MALKADPLTPDTVPRRTTPPGRYVVLYDGHCRFCTKQARNLLALARPGALEAVSFQDPGALDAFPGLTYETCMKAMILVTPDGRCYAGAEAIAQALATRTALKVVALIYYLPVVRQLCDALYARIAAYRYRIMGRVLAEGGCDGGTCSLHARHSA